MKHLAIAAVGLALVVGVVATACGGGEEGLPADFPEDFPVFEGADLISIGEKEQLGALFLSATWETDAPAEEVVAFYQEALHREPWIIAKPPGGAPGIYFVRPDREGLFGSVLITTGVDRTLVIVLLSP